MVSAAKKVQQSVVHAPLLHHPWFAGSDEGVTLHRYFDDQFVQRFVQEAMSNRLTATRAQSWYNGDRFGRKDLPTLRLPMHQTFYTVCCEVSCDAASVAGKPAFDPQRISSAGFVIRRRSSNGVVQRWMVNEGQALGWQSGAIPSQEPDDYRRFINHKLVQPQYPEPGYSGEESYPLHPLLVRSKQPNNNSSRSRTLLWGYLPLGGNYRTNNSASNTTTQAPAEATNALRQELSWPFGERNLHSWVKQDNRPALRGRATTALYELLELLLVRYRIFEQDADNGELRRQLAEIHFYPQLLANPPTHLDPYAAPAAINKGQNLLSWIETSRDALLEWLSNIAIAKTTLASSPLPNSTLNSAGNVASTSLRNDDLYITEQQAQRLRDTLLLRGGRAMVAIEEGLAMPRFGQGDDDSFFVVPFVRWQDECGCEQIHWGQQGSIDFRVVSPFDPEAQRPRAVILPGLSDIKRGAAKGVTLVVPKSVAELLRKIKPDMKMEQGGPGNPTGLCWNFSLSIPVVTICAFVLLMIVMNLLNLIFRWLPWAFLALPRLCGKLLSENK